MTEAEWLTATRPTAMLLHIRTTASERKVLLFNCACCRRVRPCLGAEDQNVVTQAEASADDPAAIKELDTRLEPERVADLALVGLLRDRLITGNETLVALLLNQTTLRLCLIAQGYGIGSLAFAAAELVAKPLPKDPQPAARVLEEKAQSELVRDMFGNPVPRGGR
jgi:hypothetical protein